MPDSRFFETLAPTTVQTLLDLTDATLVCGDASAKIVRVAAYDEAASSNDLVYCETAGHIALLKKRKFGLCFTTKKLTAELTQHGALAVTETPKASFAQCADLLHRSKNDMNAARHFPSDVSVHPTAVIASSASISTNVTVGPHVYIGPGVSVGTGSVIGPGAVITHAYIGKHVQICPGARIGQAGFGFVQTAKGLMRVPQLGCVMIGDGVEVGANTTIDRGALNDTVIGDYTKIDNLVQIGHNVRVGRGCVIAAQTGISGSCVVGDGVMMGGRVGLTDHVKIGNEVMLAAGSGLMHDVPDGQKWGGSPAKPIRDWLREVAMLERITKKRNG